MAKIEHIKARQVLDSRGNPTVEADVFLEDGAMGRAIVPSGASTGAHEAHELRDHVEEVYRGLGVQKAVQNINGEIAQLLVRSEASEQVDIDRKLVDLDGTKTKGRLGANAILAVSLAVAKAEANSRGQYLFEYVGGLSRLKRVPLLPLPMCNLINGGRHASHSTDIQEFMIIPISAPAFSEALRMSSEIFHTLREVLVQAGYNTTVGDEGGFAPTVKKGNKEALELLMRAVELTGYIPGKDVVFGIDAASNEFLNEDGKYHLESEERILDVHELIEYYASLINEFPLVSIEDGLSENDWDGWKVLNERFGDDIQIVGDDFLVTNVSFLKRAIEEKAANAILVKVNQIGTLTETIDAVDTAHEAGWRAILSHRSGETEDTTIAHLAVGLSAGQIKTGSLSRSERIAKYNELLRIEEDLGEDAQFENWTNE